MSFSYYCVVFGVCFITLSLYISVFVCYPLFFLSIFVLPLFRFLLSFRFPVPFPSYQSHISTSLSLFVPMSLYQSLFTCLPHLCLHILLYQSCLVVPTLYSHLSTCVPGHLSSYLSLHLTLCSSTCLYAFLCFIV